MTHLCVWEPHNTIWGTTTPATFHVLHRLKNTANGDEFTLHGELCGWRWVHLGACGCYPPCERILSMWISTCTVSRK